MGLFNNLTTEGLEDQGDRLGGGRVLLDSGVYDAVIKLAYAGKSPNSNAQNINLVFELADGREYRETIYITNKNNENFFLNDAKKKIPLPGFSVVSDLCYVASGKELHQQDTEEKVVKIYDFEEKKELPKSVPVLVDIIGAPVKLGILKVQENKSDKQDDGSYKPNAEVREVNYIDKPFHGPTGLTATEIKNGLESPEQAAFLKAWSDKNTGVTVDRRKIKDGASAQDGKAGKPGGPPQAGAAPKPTSSLFGSKS